MTNGPIGQKSAALNSITILRLMRVGGECVFAPRCLEEVLHHSRYFRLPQLFVAVALLIADESSHPDYSGISLRLKCLLTNSASSRSAND